MDTYLASFERRESFEMEYRLKRHDGLWRWINDRGVPTFDAEHRFTGYIGSCMDVTEKVEGRKLGSIWRTTIRSPACSTETIWRF